MELTVRTLRGSVNVKALAEDATVESLKAQLHESYKSSLQIPIPEQQNLVFGGRVLTNGQLRSAGVSQGSTLVVLQTTPIPACTPAPHIPAPSAADIRAAIFDEARRRGIEYKLRDEVSMPAHVSLNLPSDLMDMDNQLMGLIEALAGSLHQGERQSAAGGETALLSGAGNVPAQLRTAAEAQAQPAAEPVAHIQPPEPEAEHVTQLCDMGFSDAVVRKALILHRNRVPEAVEWLLQHSEDPDAAEPVTQEQLLRVYGAAHLRPAATVQRGADPAGEGPAPTTAAAGAVASALRELRMSLLQAVGIDADSAQGLLDRNDAGAGPQATGQTASAAVVGRQQAAAPVDPLEAFRRQLQQRLGVGQQHMDVSATSLEDLFPLEALGNLIDLGAANDDGDDTQDDENDEDREDEEEEEEEEEEDEEEEEEDEPHVQQNVAPPDTFGF